jgi:hypothetical protein
VDVSFTGEVWRWDGGPPPFYFVTVPDDESRHLSAVVSAVTYGWGMVPVRARIGGTEWQTALTPQDGRYLLPLKVAVRRAEGVDLGDRVSVELSVDDGRWR